MVYSSIIINCEANQFESVKTILKERNEVEIAETAENKLAVVLEANTTEEIALLTEELNSCNGVSNVEIISHFFEDETLTDEK